MTRNPLKNADSRDAGSLYRGSARATFGAYNRSAARGEPRAARNPMFEMLSERLGKAVDALRGRGRLTEENIADTLRQVRMALLEADVAVPVVKAFTDAARVRAVGAEVMKSLTPGQALIGIIHEELTRVMGPPGGGLNLRATPPVVVLLAGLQGAGKTTTAAKLARHLIEKHRRKPLLARTDDY